MLNEKERLAKLEKQVEELIEINEREELRVEIKEGVEKFINEQEKGLFKYSKDVFKGAVILSAFYAGGNKVLEIPWIQEFFKQ
jgi:hypothetical protein